MKKGTIIILIVLIVVVIGLICFFAFFVPPRILNFSKCSEPINLMCLGNNTVLLDNIPCNADLDCQGKAVSSYCLRTTGGNPSWTDCIGENDYCGKDGFCKQCQCNH